MVNNYLDKVKYLSQTYKFISLKKEYKFGDYKNAHVINRPSFLLNDLLIKTLNKALTTRFKSVLYASRLRGT